MIDECLFMVGRVYVSQSARYSEVKCRNGETEMSVRDWIGKQIRERERTRDFLESSSRKGK